ncbi:hypothetical protein Micbo1qcDRAFT_183229 [Microdochium bolleyi]|uniref:Rhodopsin domain-containing protein n=1 Tax=Microdochium bolleyi TaxID=196109 RepID=A0A136J8Q4_9PEZI|nr:hypothetical protein Micbo1qcDRAFT_183229 [Microdochium bolleyi]
MEGVTTEAYVMLGMGLAVIAVRVALRIRTTAVSRLSTDDYLMIVAAILYIAETYIAWSVEGVWAGKANNGLTTDQREEIVEGSEEYLLRVGGSKTQVAVQCFFVALLWTLKCAVCSFYWRLMGDIKGYRLRVLLACLSVAASWLAVQLTLFCSCVPFHRDWQIQPDPGNRCYAAVSRPFLVMCLLMDIATDAYLLAIPLPMLWQTKGLTKAQKIGLTVVFCAGFTVIICAVARNTILLVHPDTGAHASGDWAVRETFLAVLTSNLAVLYSSFRLWRNKDEDGVATSSK